MYLEVCVDSLESAVNAVKGGADELEICSSLGEGGLTPTVGLVDLISKKCSGVKLNVMLRCRPGCDFIYNDLEMETMLQDLEFFKKLPIHSFVFGALTKEFKLDEEKCVKVIQQAFPFPVSLHRAFDMAKNHIEEMKTAIKLGFKRILTSGSCPKADDTYALKLLNTLVETSQGKIEIMPGAGVNCDNIEAIARTGAIFFHSSCKIEKKIVSGLSMGVNESNCLYVCSDNLVNELKTKINNLMR